MGLPKKVIEWIGRIIWGGYLIAVGMSVLEFLFTGDLADLAMCVFIAVFVAWFARSFGNTIAWLGSFPVIRLLINDPEVIRKGESVQKKMDDGDLLSIFLDRH